MIMIMIHHNEIKIGKIGQKIGRRINYQEINSNLINLINNVIYSMLSLR